MSHSCQQVSLSTQSNKYETDWYKHHKNCQTTQEVLIVEIVWIVCIVCFVYVDCIILHCCALSALLHLIRIVKSCKYSVICYLFAFKNFFYLFLIISYKLSIPSHPMKTDIIKTYNFSLILAFWRIFNFSWSSCLLRLRWMKSQTYFWIWTSDSAAEDNLT